MRRVFGTGKGRPSLARIFSLAVLTASLAACGINPESGIRPGLLLRLAASGSTFSGSTDLAGATLSGTVKILVGSSTTTLRAVAFYLDTSALPANEVSSDGERAFLVDLSCQADGAHVLGVTAESAEGGVLERRVAVTIENGAGSSCSAEPPDDAPSPPQAPPAVPPIDPPVQPPDAPASPVFPGTDRPLPAATMYVSQDGSASANGRSIDAPTTLSRATELVGPGDVVYLRGGVYPIQVRFKRSGTASAPIVWTSHPGEWAVLDGADRPVVESGDRVWVQGIQHNEFRNFEVRFGPREGIYVEDSHHNLFSGIVTHDNHYSGILNVRSDQNRYEYVVSHSNFDYANPYGRVGDDADGISISSGDGNELYRVVVYGNSDDGIDTWVSTNTVIDGAISFGNGQGAYGNGNGIKAGGRDSVVNTIVRNSIAFQNRSHGFDDNSGRGVEFIHTTAFGNGGYAYVAGKYTTLRYSVAFGGRGPGLWDATSVANSWDLGISDPGFLSTNPTNSQFLTPDQSSPIAERLDSERAALGAIQVGDTFAAWIAPLADYISLSNTVDPALVTARR